MYTPRISAIVPFCNSETTLPACLESLRAQTLEDIEIILVDDGSTDDSLEVVRNFADGFEGSCVILSQDNKGPSAARNKGLGAAKGDYIAFVDSDDAISPTMFEKMYSKALEWDADIVSCGRVARSVVTGEIIKTVIPAFDVLRGSLEETPSIFKRTGQLMCDKIFRRTIAAENHIQFDEELAHAEDFLFICEFKLHVNCVAAVGEPLYIYNMESSRSLSGSNRRVLDIPLSCERALSLYEREGILESVRSQMLFVLIGFYLRKVKDLSYFSPILRSYKKSFKRLFKEYRFTSWRKVVARRSAKMLDGAEGYFLLLKALL